MRRHPYLMIRNKHYYFRIATPQSLLKHMGRREILQSLKTQDYAEAKIRCAALVHVMEEIFKEAHQGREIADWYLKECLNRLDFKNDSSPSYSVLLSKLSVPATISDKPATSGSASKGNEDTVSQTFERYIAECLGDRLKTIEKKRAVLRLWVGINGDGAVNSLNKAQARDFKQCLMKLPSNINKRYRGLSVREVLEKEIPESEKLSITSINHALANMGTFVNWMINNGYYSYNNPFTGLSLKDTEKTKEKRHSFSEAQLQAIFKSPVYKGCLGHNQQSRYVSGDLIIKDSFYWIPLIALFTGARMQEICQLYVADLKLVSDTWVFDFNEDGDDKRLKNSASRRQTPMHPKLIELGLLEYLKRQSNHQRLFPDLTRAADGTYSNTFSKKFNYFLSYLGVKTDKTSFHSFRHTFIDYLRQFDVPREIREAIVGHSGNKTAHDDYGSRERIPVLKSYISRVQIEI